MKELFTSPAKIVFILLAVASSAGFFLGILSEENFMILAAGAFSFFFSYKGNESKDYAGK
jgi:hypothetical protein